MAIVSAGVAKCSRLLPFRPSRGPPSYLDALLFQHDRTCALSTERWALSQPAPLSRLRCNERKGIVMKVFVAGATGVLGRVLVPQLVARGHEVVGMTRSASKQDLVRGL